MSCWCISSRSCPLCRSCGWSFYEPSHMTYQLGTHLVPPPVAVRLQVGRNGTAYVPGPWAYNHHTQWLLRWAYQSWQHTVDQRANPPASSAGHWFMLVALRSTNSVSPKGRSPLLSGLISFDVVVEFFDFVTFWLLSLPSLSDSFGRNTTYTY